MIDSHRPLHARDCDELLLPARRLNEYVYCPRLFYLEHVDGIFLHNSDTLKGSAVHKRVDKKVDPLPVPTVSNDNDQDVVVHSRSVTLSSEKHGIIAKMDLIEASGNKATPVDYKKGAPKRLDDGSLGARDPERVQICAQALVLRDNGYSCDEGVLFFWKTRQRVRISIDDQIIQETEQAIRDAVQTANSSTIPEPLIDSPKCPRCSLVSICLPDETRRCRRMTSSEAQGGVIQKTLFNIGVDRVEGPWPDAGPDELRQLVTPKIEKRPLYLNSQGFRVGKTGKILTVKDKDKTVQEIRLNDVNQVNLFGNVQVSTQAVQTLLGADVPLAYFSYGGWFQGITQPIGLKNIIWRREQFRSADDPWFCLKLAQDLVSGKIRNQRTMLMRNHIEPPQQALQYLKTVYRQSENAESLEELLGFEGVAARVYFEHFKGMIKLDAEDLSKDEPTPTTGDGGSKLDARDQQGDSGRIHFSFDFEGRNRRPPRDPVNALLSLGYSLLSKDLTIAAMTTGLDPFMGFYHQPRFGRPALALDLMEPFRPLIVDSAVISCINQRMVTTSDFISAGGAVALTPNGRKAFFRAYEQRMDQMIVHPLFGYRVSYRRLLEIQTRLLARVLLSEIKRYPVFVTR